MTLKKGSSEYSPTTIRVVTFLLTAETGHNWGSPHDREGECSPSDQQGGRYIMYPSSSPKIQINSLVQSAEDKIPCGNGVVDIREECDAGPDGLEGKDKCCSSICLLRENARCRQTLTADQWLHISLSSFCPCSQWRRLPRQQGECVSEKDVPCGNGIVDEREECDVGKSVVKNQDKCCNGTCHLRESAQCRGQCINGRCITTYCKELEKRIIGATEPACVIMTKESVFHRKVALSCRLSSRKEENEESKQEEKASPVAGHQLLRTSVVETPPFIKWQWMTCILERAGRLLCTSDL
ncbi:hypothetical protein C0Q70_00619 [Pomacea canaliculata]|uniref:Disintegrin domain-containing protein n=1 Tax=Pomacea canaliculata TaxID=400727 RepID=A0A2T7PX70_POMCA|nr:hypothetical protein C0Q70_00619 [Pomacea canaliculata]